VNRVLHILRDPALDGPTNMARDEHLLHSAPLRPAVLRLYAWTPPTISLGYFQRYADVAGLPADLRDLPVVRRITGGGAILHDREVTYSLVLDNSVPVATQTPLALYQLVHECWRLAAPRAAPSIESAPHYLPLPTPRTGPFFCFQNPGRTDLTVGGQKLLGSAQRRTPGSVLQHGSLLLGHRFASHPGADLGDPAPELVAAWVDAFIVRLAATLALEGQPTAWTADQLADVAARRARYAGAEWTRRR
jgi:lipoate-protein ligase A